MKMVKRIFILFVILFAQNTLSAQTSNTKTILEVNQDLPLKNVGNRNSSGPVLIVSESENTLKPLQELHPVIITTTENDSSSVAPKVFDPLTMDSKPE